jgi:hypothetical protein
MNYYVSDYVLVRIWDEELYKYVDTWVDVGAEGFFLSIVKECHNPPMIYVTEDVIRLDPGRVA